MDTRERTIGAALTLFSEHGFHGASIDRIAREVGVTKQALLHHFGSKEKLYGAVLATISDRLLGEFGPATATGKPATSGFAEALQRIFQHTLAYPEETQLLMRELLDNRRRAAQAATWYLRPFLDRLHTLLSEVPGWSEAGVAEIATHVYQLLGAINYFAVSRPTLENMYSAEHVAGMEAAFSRRLAVLASMAPG